MRKNSLLKKCLLGICLAACIGTGAAGAAYAVNAANEADVTFTLSEELAESYLVGDSLIMPTGRFGEVQAEMAVVYPDGSVKKAQRLDFSVAGVYTLRYAAKIDGVRYCEEKRIVVNGKKYGVDKQASSVEYKQDFSFGYFSTDPAYADATVEKEGLYVTLTEGAVFTYNKVFDLSGKKKEDILFRANIVASETGFCDFWTFTVRFTDAYDEKNYVDVVLWHSGNADMAVDQRNDGTNYIRAGASNQTPTGYEVGRDSVNVGRYGNYAYVSMMNRPSTKNGDRSADTLNISFDYAEKIVYGPEYRMTGKNMVVDLDDPKFFTEFWKGFTTGECKVSFFASDFKTSAGGVFVQSIFDDEGADFKENLLVDTQGPSIDVELGEYEGNIPFAVVGEKYNIFPASVKDLSGIDPQLTAKVYYNYNSAPIAVGVKDGAFVPNKTGAYTICYVATDCFGNQSQKEIKISCVSADEKLITAYGDVPTTEGHTGTYISVAEVLSEGYSGTPMYEITAICGENRYPIDLTELQFRPLKSGEYTIEYKTTDYVGRVATASYTVAVSDSENPVYMDEVWLPKYFVAGYEQTLPALNAYDFKQGGASVAAEIYVKEGAEPERKLVEGKFTPVVKDEPYTVQVCYRAQGANGVGEKTYEVPCYSIYKEGATGKIDKAALFVLDEGVEASYQALIADDTTTYASYQTETDAGITYINPVPAHGFSMEFNIFEEKNAFEKLNVILTDAEDENVSFKMTYEKKDDASLYVSINGGTKFTVDGYSFFDQSTRITCSYDNAKKTAYTDHGKEAFAVATDKNGEPFEGFASGKVYLRIEFEGVTGEAQIAVRKIWNQQLVASTRDNTSAVLVLGGTYGQRFSIGQSFTILHAVYMDMIDPESVATMTFTSPSGMVVEGADGFALEKVDIEREYSVLLTEYGKYKLVYELDSGEALEYYFEVVDEVPPTIVVKTQPKDSYKVGASLKISAVATDEISGECQLFVCVENAYGEIEYITEKSYRFQKAGVYRITYYAMDEFGNYGYKTYVMTVEEK